MLNRVKIEIMGSSFNVASMEEEGYVLELSRELNDQVLQLMDSNSTMSLNGALVLCALSYADALKKSESSADNIRGQLTEYLNESSKNKYQVDDLRRENERLKKRLEAISNDK